MTTKSNNFKARLGMFVAVGMALFIIAIFYIGRQKHLFNPVFKVSALFKNVSGLEIGNNVRFSGINVGTVDNIQIINDTTVRVDVVVDKNIQKFVRTDCAMTIGSEGLIGDKIIIITQGTNGAKQIKENAFLAAVEPVETDAILGSLKVTGENAEIISDQLAQILYKVNNGQGTFGMLINDSTMAESIYHTIDNLKSSTRGLDENMEAAKHNILLRGYFKNKAKKEAEAKEEKNQKKDRKDSDDPEEENKDKKGIFKKLFKSHGK